MTLAAVSAVTFAEGKIAVVNPQGAMLGTAYAAAKIEKFQKSSDFVTTKAKLDGIIAEINALQTSFKKDGQTWSQEKKEESERKVQSLNQDYQFNLKKIQEAQQAVAQQVMQEIGGKAEAAIKQIVESEKIGLLLSKEAAIFATADYDITAKVVDAINKMPDQAPAAPAKK